MQIKFKINFFDVYLFSCIHAFFSLPQHLAFVSLSAMITSWAGDFAAGPQGVESGDVPAVMAIVAGASYLALWGNHCVLLLFWQLTANAGKSRGARTLDIREAGLFEECPYNQSLMYWKGLYKVVERPGFCAIFTNSLHYFVIPHRSFSSKQERIRFGATMRAKIAAVSAQGAST